MRYGVLGTGMVGQTLASRLAELGHEVMMGSRTAENKEAQAWRQRTGGRGHVGTFRDAAAFGDTLLNCTQGAMSPAVLQSVDPKDLVDKVLIDVANPLDLSGGGPPTLTICNTDSLGERLQRDLPRTKVVKTLNTCNCRVMVDPARAGLDHDVFICGNDAEAKETVKALLRELGWKTIIDLGDITAARGTEQLMPIWLRLYGLFGSADFNFKIVRS
jgi:8-hydroxy-5-deazaflavin:NADPH oxidoreductase